MKSTFLLTVAIPLALLSTTPQIPVTLQGRWVNDAVSQALSREYRLNITVANVKIDLWSTISFDSLEVRSKEGKLFMNSGSGTIRLQKLGLGRHRTFQAEINLKDLSLAKDLYRRSPYSKPWGYLMHRPLHIKNMRINVARSKKRTLITLTECRSQDIILAGSILLEKADVVKDDTFVAFTPRMILRAIF